MTGWRPLGLPEGATGMDDVRETLAEVVAGMLNEEVPAAAAHEVGRRVLDTIGIALGGWEEAPSRVMRSFAASLPVEGGAGATVWGTDLEVAPEVAALANGTMMHSQDYMDTYLSPSGEACHPADLIPGLIALCEHSGRSVPELIRAVIIGYEVACRLCDAAEIRNRGWDHVTYLGIAAACAGAALVGLEGDGVRRAISLATVPNVALRQTRNGELTMWKACAPANAVSNAVRAVRLAAFGLEGPGEPFTGVNGLERRVSGPLDRDALRRSPGEDPAILRTHIKSHPVQYNAQAGIDAALAIRSRLTTSLADDPIASVRLTMSDVCHQFTADSPNKWDPMTRETADHSLPYLVVTALREGRIVPSDFEASGFRDPERLRDVGCVEAIVEPAMTAVYPQQLTVRVELEQRSGATSVAEVDHPLGHARSPMTDAEVEAKFRRLADGRVDPDRIDRVASVALRLQDHASIGALMGAVRPGGASLARA